MAGPEQEAKGSSGACNPYMLDELAEPVAQQTSPQGLALIDIRDAHAMLDDEKVECSLTSKEQRSVPYRLGLLLETHARELLQARIAEIKLGSHNWKERITDLEHQLAELDKGKQ